MDGIETQVDTAEVDRWKADFEIDEWALAIVADNQGDHLAAIRSLLVDVAYMRHELALAAVAMSTGFTRGWRPKTKVECRSRLMNPAPEK